MDLNSIEKPFTTKLGFNKLFQSLSNPKSYSTDAEKSYVSYVIANLKNKEILSKGLSSSNDIKDHIIDIKNLLGIIFPTTLSSNEIKAAFVPMSSYILHSSSRYNSIFNIETELLEKEFGEHDSDSMYIMMCSYILKSYYNISIGYKSPPVYAVVDNEGITKYYRSTYNADYIELYPIGEAPVITSEIVYKLKEGIENVKVWKEIFPSNSWEVSGFGIKSFIDISIDESIARIKNNLLFLVTKKDEATLILKDDMDTNISTLLNIPNVKSTFTRYDSKQKVFNKIAESDLSFALGDFTQQERDELMCTGCQNEIFVEKQPLILQNVGELPKAKFQYSIYKSIFEQGFNSYMAIPLYDGDNLLGILEFAHVNSFIFDKTHVSRIKLIQDQCANVIKQFNSEWESNISSIIQHEFTSIHPSVEWKFIEEAEKKAKSIINQEDYNFNKISFDGLTALYGQMDISGSSTARNEAIAADLKNQLLAIKKICLDLSTKLEMPIIGNFIYEVGRYDEMLTSEMDAGREQEIKDFFIDSIHPFFDELKLRDQNISSLIESYYNRIHKSRNIFYEKRKDYDDTVNLINKHLSSGLDTAQVVAQNIYPHYFERYKTDGVEHNIFVGQSISPDIHFNKLYLENLRLWQLENMCKLEIEHHNRLDNLPIPLQVASLIMVYSNTLAIRYRLDEKQFDIDGAYNARYEIIKKRIDKAHIKGTSERITQPGKIVIIYTHSSDLKEQERYIKYLISKDYLTDNIETFDIEDLQGVSGLKGIRVELNYPSKAIPEISNDINVNEILSDN